MKIWQWTIWTTLVALFLLNQYIERILHIQIPFLYSYFDDLLAVPITLGAYQWIMNDVVGKKDFRISISLVIICITGFAFHFEILMPAISAKYTRDLADILMYITGGIGFIFIYTGTTFRRLTLFRKTNAFRSYQSKVN